ncbi:hypothetical protein [Arenimonas sp.]|uniref:hypothetical protein n=1 Tax=Arenimonas sp. TaxID=1872635 RepID=UPI0039E421E7
MPTHAEFNRPSALAAQFLPPFLCLWPLFSRNDAMLYAGAAASVVVIATSLLSLVIRLSRPRERRGRLLRAVMAMALACVALAYFHSERQIAMRRINSLADGLQLHCRQYGGCPLKIEGWQAASPPFASQFDDRLGRVAHRYLYSADRETFRIYLDVGGGFLESVEGGRKTEVRKAGTLPSPHR